MSAVSQSSTSTVRELVAALGSLAPATDDHDRIERVRLFEELKSIAAAAQALEARDFDRSQRTAQAVAGQPPTRQGRGVAGQLALARRCSPWAAQRWLGWCTILPEELPHTFAALQAGVITEWRASLVARETLFLSREDRMSVDAELAPRLQGWGDKQVAAETRRAAYRLDPHASLARCRAAEKDRRVTLRPAPDTMTRRTALLPVTQGVAAYAALCQAADTTTAAGDDRGRGQLMADTLVQRLTGQPSADAVPVEIGLVITDTTLLDDGDEPGELVGYGPVPARQARDLALDRAGRRWLRRLFTSPETGQLVAMDCARRRFTDGQSRFIRYRDAGRCRTPWCGAPIRHTDHIEAHVDGGPTHTDNGRGSCEACNYAKQAPGWHDRRRRDGSIVTTTPTGQTYTSRQPDPPGTAPPPAPDVDRRLTALSRLGRLGRLAA